MEQKQQKPMNDQTNKVGMNLTAVSEATENDEEDQSRDFNCENDESFN